jgi:DNA-binding IclR family transcriptional regulator
MTSTQLDSSRILEVGMGFWPSKTLLSAVELRLFTELANGSMTGGEIGERLGLHPRAVYDFLDGLVAMRFLERDGDGAHARYRNTSTPTNLPMSVACWRCSTLGSTDSGET